MNYFKIFILIGFISAQEFEVEGNIKVQGDLIFSDESVMSSASSGIPAGILVQFAGSTAPDGWLICDGSAVSRTTYSSLFDAIATTYGLGDGSSTFNLPDLRGRMPLGLDNMGGQSADRVSNESADLIGGSAGEEMHQLSADELPSRTGYISHSGSNQNNDSGGMYYVTSIQNGIIGDDQAHNNMPPYIALNYIIKY